jgi:hypothetical protein
MPLKGSGGSVRVLGEDISDPARALAVKRRVGVVPENLALFDNLTAREYLTFVGRMYLLPLDTVKARSEELLAIKDGLGNGVHRDSDPRRVGILARRAENPGRRQAFHRRGRDGVFAFHAGAVSRKPVRI